MEDWLLISGDNHSEEEIVISSTVDEIDIEEEEEEEEEEYSSDEKQDSCDYEIEFFDDTEDLRAARMDKIMNLVLPRLPAESLLRFKSVCPNFNKFISSPFTVLSHAIHPKRVSGVFYHMHGNPCYQPFPLPDGSDLPDPRLSFIPEPITIMASTRGILCLRGRKSYYVANPVTMEWAELPKPLCEHGEDVAVVILFGEPSVYNFDGDYQIVCANPVVDGVYTFETFSSKSWTWAQSSGICPAGYIVATSGVAVRAAAYWRTTEQTILEYVANKDSWRILNHEIDSNAHCELGEMDGNLCITSVSTLGAIQVEEMFEVNGIVTWRRKGGFAAPWEDFYGRTVILRAQGKAETMIWEVDFAARRELVLRDLEGTMLNCIDNLVYFADFLPFVPTLLPVKR